MFNGRLSRKEYFVALLLFYVGLFILGQIVPLSITGEILLAYIALYILLGMLLGIRRLHDMGASGWWIFLYPLTFWIFLLVLLLVPGEKKKNRYGESPASRKINISCIYLGKCSGLENDDIGSVSADRINIQDTKCAKCGNEINSFDLFCGKCGAKIVKKNITYTDKNDNLAGYTFLAIVIGLVMIAFAIYFSG